MQAAKRFSIPGKVFLLGEYAVMAGCPAWIATVPPRFSLRGVEAKNWNHPFAEASPAGRLVHAWKNDARAETAWDLSFEDGYQGAGGFGGSTAEFALVAALRDEARGEAWAASVWREYRDGFERVDGLLPSGADLYAQMLGGVQRVRIRSSGEISASPLSSNLAREHWLVWSATQIPGRKVQTHRHLAGFQKQTQLHRDLEQKVADAELALQAGDWRQIGRCLSAYAEVLQEQGLECDAARADRLALSPLPGVLGFKGCGALLADAAVAVVENAAAASTLIEAAAARGLRLVAQGLPWEQGLRSE